MLPKINFNNNSKIIAYKLLNDLLFILLVFFLLTLAAEGLLPGIVSSHLAIYKLIVIILLNILAIESLAKNLKITIPERKNKKTIFFISLALALLLFNQLLKLNIVLSLALLALLFLAAYFLYKVLFQEEII